jgi:hypothetical protein
VKIGAARTGAGGGGATGFGAVVVVGAFVVVGAVGAVVVVVGAVVVVVGAVVVVVGAVVVVVGAVVVVVGAVVVVVGAVVVVVDVVVVGAVVVVVLVVVVGAVVVVVDVEVVVTGGGGKQNEMWLMPLPSGAVSPVSEVTPGAAYVYTFAFGPPLTMTWVTGLFEVKLNAVGSPSALTAVTVIVTDRAPWLNVLDSPTPRSSMSSAWIVNVVVPSGQLGLPGCTTGVTLAAGAEVTEPTMATTSPAATASAAAAAIVTIHRPGKRDPRVLERPIPSPCVVRPAAQAGGVGVRGTLGRAHGLRKDLAPPGERRPANFRPSCTERPSRLRWGGRVSSIPFIRPKGAGASRSLPPAQYTGELHRRFWPVPARLWPLEGGRVRLESRRRTGAEAGSTYVTGGGAPLATA